MTVQKNLRVFEYRNSYDEILNPLMDDKDKSIDDCAKKYARIFLSELHTTRTPSFRIPILSATIDQLASTHCDKWVEGASLHFMLYTGQDRPSLSTASEGFGTFKLAKYRGYSGDISGIIGETLFSLILVREYQTPEYQFAHFGSTTIIYPDFGVYQPTEKMKAAAEKELRANSHFQRDVLDLPDFVLPAEVKAMATPDSGALKNRIAKAIRQIRSFWRTRKLRNAQDVEIKRGTSLLFVAIRNEHTASYDGFILWMT